MRILDRCIRHSVISATAIVLLILLGIESFMELVTELSDIGKGNFGILQVLMYVPLRLPADLYQFFPIAGFLGSLIGLGRLASTSQLIVMRASGVSIARIAWAVIKAAMVMIVVVTFIGEYVAPKLQAQATQIKATALGHQVGLKAVNNVWLRKDNTFVHIGSVRSPTEIQDVSVFRYNRNRQLQSSTFANKAIKSGQHWTLLDAKQTLLSANKVMSHSLATMPLAILFDPKLLFQSRQEVAQDSVLQIAQNIFYRKASGLLTNQFELTFWQRVLQPLTTIIMICLGIPFIFGSLRSSSMGVRILTGIIVGFIFYMINRLFGPVVIVYQFSPLLAAITPSVMFLLAYVILMRRAY